MTAPMCKKGTHEMHGHNVYIREGHSPQCRACIRDRAKPRDYKAEAARRQLPKPTVDELFWAKVDKSGECWLWTAQVNPQGYGQFAARSTSSDGSYRQKHWRAHRYAWTVSVGPIPDGLELDHLCKVVNCVRPDHLEVVTGRENVLRSDCPPAINARKTHCIRNHPFSGANLRFNSKGGRYCATCTRVSQRIKARERRARLRESLANVS